VFLCVAWSYFHLHVAGTIHSQCGTISNATLFTSPFKTGLVFSILSYRIGGEPPSLYTSGGEVVIVLVLLPEALGSSIYPSHMSIVFLCMAWSYFHLYIIGTIHSQCDTISNARLRRT